MYKNPRSLSWQPYHRDLLLSFGVKKYPLDGKGQGSRPEMSGNENWSKGTHQSVHILTEDLYRRHFFPGPDLNDFSNRTLGLFNHSLRWKTLPSRYTVDQEPIPLNDFCANVMTDTTILALFGDSIYAIEPRLTQVMVDFNEEAWKLLIFPYPKFAARRLHSAKEGIRHALLSYVQSLHYPSSKEAGLMAFVLEELEAADVGKSDRASIAFFFLWA